MLLTPAQKKATKNGTKDTQKKGGTPSIYLKSCANGSTPRAGAGAACPRCTVLQMGRLLCSFRIRASAGKKFNPTNLVWWNIAKPSPDTIHTAERGVLRDAGGLHGDNHQALKGGRRNIQVPFSGKKNNSELLSRSGGGVLYRRYPIEFFLCFLFKVFILTCSEK